jgi:hypothetical protein
LVEVIADQVIGPRRGVVEALGSPEDPTLSIAVDEEGEGFCAVGGAIPADGAIAPSSDLQPLPDHSENGLVQVGGEAVSQLLACIEALRH